MVYIQQYEHGQFANQPNHRKLGSGLYLNPYYGKGCNNRNGDGFADVFSSLINTGTNFIKNHGSTIASVANIASGAANTIKAIKEIKNNDEKLYELKRIKQEIVPHYMILTQPQLYSNSIEKINIQRLSASNNANNLDGTGQQIQFHKGRTNDYIRLGDSYIEVTFSYTTQTPVGTAADAADITFENDFFSKLFDNVELRIGGCPIEPIIGSNYVTELAGYVLYSTDEDREAGTSFGWIPDYGAGSSELTLSGLVGALSLITATSPSAANNTAINALTFAGTVRTITLCVPLWYFFQSVTTYDKILCNLDIDLFFTRTSAGVGRYAYSQVANTNIVLTTQTMYWDIPYYRPSLDGLATMTKQLNSKDEYVMSCLIRFMGSPSTAFSSSTFTYDLGSRANIPRYIFVGAKWDTFGGNNQVDMVNINRSLFTHCFITDMNVQIGSEKYPYLAMNCDFPNNKYAVPFQMFRDFCRSYGISTSINYIDYRDRFPIFIFDLTARSSLLDTNTTSLSVQINVTRNVPAANAVDTLKLFALQFMERHFTLNFKSGMVQSNDQF